MSKYGFEKDKSKHYYKLVDLGWGFKIVPQGEDHEAVWVWMDRHGFWQVQRESMLYPIKRKLDPWTQDSPLIDIVDSPSEHSMFDLVGLLNRIVSVLYLSWKPKKIRGKMYHHCAPEWMERRTRKCLAKPIKRIWKRLVLGFDDPLAVKLHKKFHSIKGGGGQNDVLREMIKHPEEHVYAIRDALNIYAARVTYFLLGGRTALDLGWMNYWCPDGELSKSMKKTLSQYTGYGLGWQYMLPLLDMRDHITEPVTSRLKIMALWVIERNHGRDATEPLMQVLNPSTEEEFKRAIEIAHEQRRIEFGPDSMWNKLDFRRTKYLESTISWILDVTREMDLEQVAECKITGLARRSVDYHRNRARWERERRLEWEKKNAELLASKTALPPIDLPDDEHIRFLDTYKSVRDEGDFMQHCVAGYASSAVNGDNYLFHIQIKNSHATAQVTSRGELYQIHGPGNRHSKAVDYGEKVLRSWAKELRDHLEENGEPVYQEYQREEEEIPF